MYWMTNLTGSVSIAQTAWATTNSNERQFYTVFASSNVNATAGESYVWGAGLVSNGQVAVSSHGKLSLKGDPYSAGTGSTVWYGPNDAPSDGLKYGRMNGAWSVITGATAVAWSIITGTPTSLAGYGITNDVIEEGDYRLADARPTTSTLEQVVANGGTVTGNPVTIDSANARTNTYGGALTKLGSRVQSGGTPNASGDYSLAMGGINPTASGHSSVALGGGAQATHDYSIVLSADSTPVSSSTTNEQISLFARKGTRIQGGPFTHNGTNVALQGQVATLAQGALANNALANTNPVVLAGSLTAATVVGGTATNSLLTLQSTSGNGTSNAIGVQVAVGNNGATKAISVLNNGNVGIGATSPRATLDVRGTIAIGDVTASRISLAYSGNSAVMSTIASQGLVLESSHGSAPPIVFRLGDGTNTLERLRILQNGNVGIGTVTPTARLHLPAGAATASNAPLKFTSGTLLSTPESGAVEFLTDKWYGTRTTGTDRQPFIQQTDSLTNCAQVTSGSATNSTLTLQSTSGNGTSTAIGVQVAVGNNGATKAMTTLNNGNTGFRTATPNFKAHISSTQGVTNETLLALQSVVAGAGTGFIRWFCTSNADVTNLAYSSFIGGERHATYGHSLTFGTAATVGAVPVETMRLSGAGRLSLGTAAADTTLHVVGGITATTNSDLRIPYGSFSSSATQAIANVTREQPITFDTSEETNGISLQATTNITVDIAGMYEFDFSGLYENTAGAARHIEVWIATNGVAVPRSNTRVQATVLPSEQVVTVALLQRLAAGDKVQFMTSGDDTAMKWLSVAAGTSPARPACPSVIVTVKKISR
jgi:hypothetical protein